MRRIQVEIRVPVMIKQPDGPSVWVMTLLALTTLPAFVNIRVLVAFNTAGRHGFKGQVLVTGLAGGKPVKSQQWKTGQVMAETSFLRPACWRMTLVTLDTPERLMGTILVVAVLTLLSSVRRFTGHMASVAAEASMLSC